MTRRTKKTLLIVVSLLLLLGVAVFLRSKAPPEAARLLPESNGILYANLRPLRAFVHKSDGANATAPKREAEYEEFVRATGFDWERDLDEIAIAIHKMDNPTGPNGPVAYSMVLVGSMKGKDLAAFLRGHGAQEEGYAGQTIFSLPSEGRTVRVAQIGYDMVAVSNYPTAEMIHSIIDRHRTAALPFSGSLVLRQHFSEVPLLSVAWGVGQIGLPFSKSGKVQVLGLELPIPEDTTLVASLRWTGALHMKVEEQTKDENAALNQAAGISNLLSLARVVTPQLNQDSSSNGKLNATVIELVKTAEVKQEKARVLITATAEVK